MMSTKGGIPRSCTRNDDSRYSPSSPTVTRFHTTAPEDPQHRQFPHERMSVRPMPLPPIDSPTTESPGYVTESDPEEDPEEYEDMSPRIGMTPMMRMRTSRKEELTEEEEHLALADSTTVIPADEPVFPPEGTEPVILPPSTDITIGARITVRPQTSISLPPEAEVERLLTMTTPSPSPPISLSPPSAGERLARCTAPPAHSPPLPPSSGCLTQIQTLRIASTQALIDAVTTALPPPSLPPLPPSLSIPSPIDRRDDIPESEQPPRKRLHLSTLGSRYEVGESSTARPTRGRGIDYRFVSTVAFDLLRDALSAIFGLSELKDFQDSLDDEEDTRSSQEYLNDLEEKYQTRALLAKSKIFFKKGSQRFSSAKATKDTQCHKCGRNGHFARDCFSKTLAPSFPSPNKNHTQPTLSSSSLHKIESKDFKAKYNKYKAKLALLSPNASTSRYTLVKNKGLIAETCEWNEEDVSSNDNEVMEVKALMALAEEERVSVSKECLITQKLPYQVLKDLSYQKLKTKYDSTDKSSVCSTFFPPLEKLGDAETVSKLKAIKTTLKSICIFKAKALKVIIPNEPSSAPSREN
ncbi:putative reverse transcriptase domain-containing protein [Tanacetum coccineum]